MEGNGSVHVVCEQCEVLTHVLDLAECGNCTAVICPTCREQTRSGWCHECLMQPPKTPKVEKMRKRGLFDERT